MYFLLVVHNLHCIIIMAWYAVLLEINKTSKMMKSLVFTTHSLREFVGHCASLRRQFIPMESRQVKLHFKKRVSGADVSSVVWFPAEAYPFGAAYLIFSVFQHIHQNV